VLVGDPASPKKRAEPPPQFSAHFIVDKRLDASIKMPLGMELGLSAREFVLDVDPPLPKRERSPPIFGPCSLWPNGWMDQDGTWHAGRPHSKRLCVRWGPSPLSPKRERISQFSAHVYCGQTAAWMKMPLGTMVNPGLRNIVLDGYQLPLL